MVFYIRRIVDFSASIKCKGTAFFKFVKTLIFIGLTFTNAGTEIIRGLIAGSSESTFLFYQGCNQWE